MSLKYEILKAAVRASGLKKRMAQLSADELIALKKKQNAKNPIPFLKDPEFDIRLCAVDGFPVMKMIHKEKTDCACMFIIGGGMVSAPRPGSIHKALKFAKETGLDLYIPYYPLCTEYPVSRAYHMIAETYFEMKKEYEAEKISLLGTSSGGNLALGLIPYLNEYYPEEERPGYIMAISPGTCIDTQEEEKRVYELDAKDVIIPAEYMKKAAEVMKADDPTVRDYMIHLQNGNFENCPKVTLIYGTEETLYGFAPSFVKAFEKYHVDYELIEGEGLFHVYPVFPVIKAAKEGWDDMIERMKKYGKGKRQ